MEENEGVDGVMELLVDQLGMGRWSLLHISMGLVAHAVVVMHTMSGAFVAPVMKYTCRLPTPASLPYNLSTSPETFHRIPGDECAYMVNGSQGEEQRPCTEWDFDNSSFASTLTSEFSLVCGQASLVPIYQSLYMVGCGIGSIVGGLLSDKFGRRKAVTTGFILYVLVGASPAWLPNIPLIFAARLCLGMLHMLTLQSAYVLTMETIPSRTRPVMGMMVAVPWALFIIVLSGLGYVFREWRELQMVASLPFLIALPLFLFIDESPHWLMVQRKEEAVLKVLSRAAAMHKVVLDPVYVDKLKDEIKGNEKLMKREEKTSIWQKLSKKVLHLLVLFRIPRLRLCTLVICLDFFMASGVYYSLSLGAVNFSADPYVYMALSGLSEVPSYTLMGPLLAYVGRKGPAIGSFLFTGAVIVLLPFIPSGLGEVNMVLALLGKVTISAVFVEFFLYASEIFPTEVRILGLGTGILASRLGSILSPFFNDLIVPVYPLAMPLVVGGLSIIASLCTLLLPETKGKKLPDLIDKVEG